MQDFNPYVLAKEIVKHITGTPAESLADFDDDPDFKLITLNDSKVFVEFDSRLNEDCPKQHMAFEIAHFIVKNYTGLKYYARVVYMDDASVSVYSRVFYPNRAIETLNYLTR